METSAHPSPVLDDVPKTLRVRGCIVSLFFV